MLKCLLFDLDGLLVDSEPLQFQAYQYALAQFDFALDIDTWHQWHTVESSTRRWVKDQGLNIDPEELRTIKKTYYENLIEHELSLKPGVRELLEKCSTMISTDTS